MMWQGARYLSPTITSISGETIGQTKSGRVFGRDPGWQKWGLEIPLEPDSLGANRLGAKLQSHRVSHGLTKNFSVPMPQHLGVGAPTAANALRSNANLAVGATTCMAVNLTAGTMHLRAGTFFAFRGAKKIYMVTEDQTLAGSAVKEVEFRPGAVQALTTPHLDFVDLEIQVNWAREGISQISYSEGILCRATIHLVEALS